MTEQWLQRFRRQEFNGTSNNASFKGIAFIIIGAESTFGRRTVEHEFPQRDIPYSEDLGRKSRVFTVEGQVLGADYLTQRDNLISVCETAGAGELIHPYYGSLNVICKNIQFTDTRRTTRTAVFEATFVETGELVFPLESDDTVNKVYDKATAALISLEGPFTTNYGILSLPIAYTQGKIDMLNSAFDAIEKAKQYADSPSTFFRALATARTNAELTVLNASSLYSELYDLVTFGLLDSTDTLDARDSFNGLREQINFSPSVTGASVDTEYISALVRSLNVITMGLLISRIDFESKEEAELFRNDVFNAIDLLILDSDTDDQVIQDLQDLKEAIFVDIENRSGTLARLTEITLSESLPALALSYQLYGTVDAEESIVLRNQVAHPGFLPGGQSIKVLLDA